MQLAAGLATVTQTFPDARDTANWLGPTCLGLPGFELINEWISSFDEWISSFEWLLSSSTEAKQVEALVSGRVLALPA